MTMREIQGFLLESYAVEVSPEFISSVTDAVIAEVGAWQARPLEPMYPVAFFDALRVKIKEDGLLAAAIKPIYTAASAETAQAELDAFAQGPWGAKFPTVKLIWLALRNITADWGRAALNWQEAMNQFAILSDERFTRAAQGIAISGGRT